MVRAMNEQFGVGAVMGTGFRVWARNIVPFVLITAVIYVPIFLWGTMTLGSAGSVNEVVRFTGYAALMTFFLNVFVTATITYGVVMELQGKRAGIGACIGVGFKRLLPAMGVAVLSLLAIGGVILLCLLPVIAIGSAGIIFLIPGVIFAMIIFCRLYVAMPASVVEKPGVMGALTRSGQLTMGRKGQIFGIVLLLGVMSWAIGKLQGAMFEPRSIADLRLSVYISLGIQVLTGSLGSVISAVAYYYLRNEKEGTSASELASVFE